MTENEQPPVPSDEEWKGWKTVFILVVALALSPVIVLAVAYAIHEL